MTVSVLPSTLESLLLPATYPALLRAPGITAIPKWKHSVANRSLDQIFHPHILFTILRALYCPVLCFLQYCQFLRKAPNHTPDSKNHHEQHE